MKHQGPSFYSGNCLRHYAKKDAYSFNRRLDYVTTRLLARDFTSSERTVAKRTYDRFIELYSADADEARSLLAVGD